MSKPSRTKQDRWMTKRSPHRKKATTARSAAFTTTAGSAAFTTTTAAGGAAFTTTTGGPWSLSTRNGRGYIHTLKLYDSVRCNYDDCYKLNLCGMPITENAYLITGTDEDDEVYYFIAIIFNMSEGEMHYAGKKSLGPGKYTRFFVVTNIESMTRETLLGDIQELRRLGPDTFSSTYGEMTPRFNTNTDTRTLMVAYSLHSNSRENQGIFRKINPVPANELTKEQCRFFSLAKRMIKPVQSGQKAWQLPSSSDATKGILYCATLVTIPEDVRGILGSFPENLVMSAVSQIEHLLPSVDVKTDGPRVLEALMIFPVITQSMRNFRKEVEDAKQAAEKAEQEKKAKKQVADLESALQRIKELEEQAAQAAQATQAAQAAHTA